MSGCSVLIVGVGNTLLRDEGIGIHAVSRLQGLNLPSEVFLLECGTDLLSIEPALAGQHRIIIVDAIQTGDEPGTIHVMREDKFDQVNMAAASVHQMSAVASAKLLKQLYPELVDTEFIFVGIEPSDITVGQQLSPEVEAAMPRLLEEVLGLLRI